ncbi:hypothetical protein FPZ42_00105 [Mucilaginibacter achroorhodeus]|uniref:Uncharacterized protein n=1 Tax=Mucilaginibacter achroorhodeus TaxID=2599294 RepID=A0A563U8E6_9SPHI|nr:hypothetical protein [Mucilaginibacter achroorhodeus]TWR27652.1 hypothetical protein FPZ42_00105 [Mucilaginibacter achroorhodeus]
MPLIKVIPQIFSCRKLPVLANALIYLLIIIATSSCSVKKKAGATLVMQENYCEPPKYFIRSAIPDTLKSEEILAENLSLKKFFTDQDILIINSLGIAEDMKKLMSLKKDTTINGKLRKLEIGNKTSKVLLLAISDINSAAAELDCEGERVDQVGSYVDDINSTRNNRYTAASIVLGALTSISGVFIKAEGLNNVVTVAGGGLTGALGFLTLNPGGKKVKFNHRRNLLKDIWLQQNTDNHFSGWIWYMLSEKSFSNKGESSLMFNLKKRWIKYQFDNDEKQANSSVIFTEGGIYKADDLHDRASMINQLQAVIRSINQNLNNLMIEMEKAETTP